MTREQAIAFFKDMNECTYGNLEEVEMAIKALEENEGLKKEVVQLREERAKLKEKLLFLEPKAELEKELLQRAIQKAREEIDGYTGVEVRGVETIPKVHVFEILDKYLGEKLKRGETDGRD
jgi:phage gp36-like protein